MIYLDNILICITAPLIVALFLVKGETRRFIAFFVIGLATCILSAYINGFLADLALNNGFGSLTVAESMTQITPVCEEVLKALPVFFFIAVFAPEKKEIIAVALAVGLGFATLENCGYILLYNADDLWFALIRGFSAGVMHAICAAVLGYGLALVTGRKYLALSGSFAILCLVITFHSIYNLLVSHSGSLQVTGYLLPLVAAAIMLLFTRKIDIRLK